jgi:two-component system response regulator AtoC
MTVRDREVILDRFVGTSAAARAVRSDIMEVATVDCPVLIEGPSGTGKELLARIIHVLSCDSSAPFEAVNCGAIPETLLESELFGHVTGAFTGAVRSHRGVFERAHSGTVLLDEIGEMPLSAQVALLRVLEEQAFRPVGGETARRTLARVIAASNRDLQREVEAGRFREDLFYRLSVFPIRIPPLRERREDIPLLIENLLDCHAGELGKTRPTVHPAAMRRLLVYSYPGNVRELQNLIRALLIQARGAPQIADAHVISVFSRHRLAHEAENGNGEATTDEAGITMSSDEIGQWVMAQLRRYQFNVAMAEKMLTEERRTAADPHLVPVTSRSGLSYYRQGELLRTLAHTSWNPQAAAAQIAGCAALTPRVHRKITRFQGSMLDALRRGGSTPGRRLAALRKLMLKLPRTYHEDLTRLAAEYECGRWT